MGYAYFASDGNYGDAAGMVIINTWPWDSADWDCIDNASDGWKAATAQAIDAHYRKLYP